MTDTRNPDELIRNAHHRSVNEKRLTNLKGGLTTRYLYDKPLIKYLHENEQPQFIFVARQSAPKFSGLNPPSWSGDTLNGGMAMHMITDKRWIMVAGIKDGDKSFEISLGNVKVADYQTGMMKHKISIEAGEFDIDIPIANTYDPDDIEEAVEYIRGFEPSKSEEIESEDGEVQEQDLKELRDRWRHKTVNRKRLTNLKIGKGTGDYKNSGVHLFDNTLGEYLHDDENSRFILAARKTAPTISGPNRPNWSGDKLAGMAMHLITDGRWLIVVGQRGGDETFEVDLQGITSIEYNTGLAGHEINISTDSHNIDVPISNMYDEDVLQLVTQYIQKPSEFEPENHESIIIESGYGDKSRAEEEERDLQELRDSDASDGEIVRELVSRAQDSSVTIERLTELSTDGWDEDFLSEKPLFEYLKPDEQPHFMLKQQIPPEFYGDYSPGWSGTKGYSSMHMISDRRWLIVQGHKDGDQSLEITFEQISSIESVNSALGYDLKITTDEGRIDIMAKGAADPTEMQTKHEDLIEFVQARANIQQENTVDESSIEIIDRTGRNPENPLYAKLIVPTQTSGATISQRGWNIGGDIVRRTSSSGTVEEEPWENYVMKLVIHENHIEIGITHDDVSVMSANLIEETQRIDLNELQDIREQPVGGKGFIFETSSDVYKFRLGKKGITSMATKEDAKDIVYKLKQAVENAPEPEEETAVETNKEENSSSIDKLSQIKELHDEGVLTDEEFEEKKQDILDRI